VSDTFLSCLTTIDGAQNYEGDGYVIQAFPDDALWRWRVVTLATTVYDPRERHYVDPDEAYEAALDWIADRMAKIAEVLGE
jgi:hypothetical protein